MRNLGHGDRVDNTTEKQKPQSSWRPFLQRWVINTLSVVVAVYVLDGIDYQKPLDLLVASLVLGVLNAILRPLLMLMSLPLVVLSLGLFLLVINALTLWLAGWLLSPHFVVKDFWSAFWGALIIGIMNVILGAATGTGRAKVHVRRGPPDKRPPSDSGGSGPVIDV